MKFFGHPIHIMLVHFPAGLLPIELLAYAVYVFYGIEAFATTSFHLTFAGVALGWLASVFGVVDLAKIQQTHKTALNPTLIHGGLNLLVMTVYSVILYKACLAYPQPQTASYVLLSVKAATNLVMLVGNYYGGNLILKHKIAVHP
jgi:uncharacterized membrane protein